VAASAVDPSAEKTDPITFMKDAIVPVVFIERKSERIMSRRLSYSGASKTFIVLARLTPAIALWCEWCRRR